MLIIYFEYGRVFIDESATEERYKMLMKLEFTSEFVSKTGQEFDVSKNCKSALDHFNLK